MLEKKVLFSCPNIFLEVLQPSVHDMTLIPLSKELKLNCALISFNQEPKFQTPNPVVLLRVWVCFIKGRKENYSSIHTNPVFSNIVCTRFS